MIRFRKEKDDGIHYSDEGGVIHREEEGNNSLEEQTATEAKLREEALDKIKRWRAKGFIVDGLEALAMQGQFEEFDAQYPKVLRQQRKKGMVENQSFDPAGANKGKQEPTLDAQDLKTDGSEVTHTPGSTLDLGLDPDRKKPVPKSIDEASSAISEDGDRLGIDIVGGELDKKRIPGKIKPVPKIDEKLGIEVVHGDGSGLEAFETEGDAPVSIENEQGEKVKVIPFHVYHADSHTYHVEKSNSKEAGVYVRHSKGKMPDAQTLQEQKERADRRRDADDTAKGKPVKDDVLPPTLEDDHILSGLIDIVGGSISEPDTELGESSGEKDLKRTGKNDPESREVHRPLGLENEDADDANAWQPPSLRGLEDPEDPESIAAKELLQTFHSPEELIADRKKERGDGPQGTMDALRKESRLCPDCNAVISYRNQRIDCNECERVGCETCQNYEKKHEKSHFYYPYVFDQPLCTECYQRDFMIQQYIARAQGCMGTHNFTYAREYLTSALRIDPESIYSENIEKLLEQIIQMKKEHNRQRDVVRESMKPKQNPYYERYKREQKKSADKSKHELEDIVWTRK